MKAWVLDSIGNIELKDIIKEMVIQNMYVQYVVTQQKVKLLKNALYVVQ